MFGNIEITKNKFYCNKTSIFKKDVDIEEVLLFSNISYGKKNYKYFIVYFYNDNKVKGTLIQIWKSPNVFIFMWK